MRKIILGVLAAAANAGESWERNMTARWPASLPGNGVSDVEVGGKAVTVTPYMTPPW